MSRCQSDRVSAGGLVKTMLRCLNLKVIGLVWWTCEDDATAAITFNW